MATTPAPAPDSTTSVPWDEAIAAARAKDAACLAADAALAAAQEESVSAALADAAPPEVIPQDTATSTHTASHTASHTAAVLHITTFPLALRRTRPTAADWARVIQQATEIGVPPGAEVRTLDVDRSTTAEFRWKTTTTTATALLPDDALPRLLPRPDQTVLVPGRVTVTDGAHTWTTENPRLTRHATPEEDR
jgi:hypothetical protein